MAVSECLAPLKPTYKPIYKINGARLQATNLLSFMSWSGMRDSNPRHPAPKAGALPDCANPRLSYQAVSLASAHNTDRACFRQCEITTSDKNIREFFQMLINRAGLDELLCL